MCKWIWIKLTVLCLCLLLVLPGMTSFADTDVRGAGADSEIKIEVVREKGQIFLTIQVVDQESGNPLPDVIVDLTDPDHPGIPPITGSPEGVSHTTDSQGKIVISLFSNPDKRYQIEVRHIGYRLYTGNIFTLTNDTSIRVELVKRDPNEANSNWDGGSYVYFRAGAGGKLEGEKQEWVPYGGSLKNLPSPVPQEGYIFLGWTLQDKNVVPQDLTVRRDMNFRAVFERIPPSPVQKPSSAAQEPSPAAQEPPPAAQEPSSAAQEPPSGTNPPGGSGITEEETIKSPGSPGSGNASGGKTGQRNTGAAEGRSQKNSLRRIKESESGIYVPGNAQAENSRKAPHTRLWIFLSAVLSAILITFILLLIRKKWRRSRKGAKQQEDDPSHDHR